jgi:hypothetical protein
MMQRVLQLAFGGLGLERVELGVFAHDRAPFGCTSGWASSATACSDVPTD